MCVCVRILQHPSIVGINPLKGQLLSYSSATHQNETEVKCITRDATKGQKVRTKEECYQSFQRGGWWSEKSRR